MAGKRCKMRCESIWLKASRTPKSVPLDCFADYPHFFDSFEQYGDRLSDVLTIRWKPIKQYLHVFSDETDEDAPFIEQVSEAIRQGEAVPPLVLNRDGSLYDGRHRAWAAHDLGIKLAPVVTIQRSANVKEAAGAPALSYFQAIETLSNPRDLPNISGIENTIESAIEAGATPPLEYMGAGAEGVVLCDEHFAYKVSRGRKDRLRNEAEWLSVASQIPEVRPYVATFESWDPEHGVIVRECVRGRHGAWDAGKKVRALWDHVAPYMLAQGWTMPEFKDDSVVFDEAGNPKLVDAGFVMRVSNRLLAYVEDILDGKIERDALDDDSTLAFYVRREFGQKEPLDETRAHRLLTRLYALGARE